MNHRAADDAMKTAVTGRLLDVWKANPDLRLMQLIGNVFRSDPYYIEDYEAIKAVEEFYEGKDGRAGDPAQPE